MAQFYSMRDNQANVYYQYTIPKNKSNDRRLLINGSARNRNSKTHGIESFIQFLWNPQTQTFCGRRFDQWFVLCIYYLIFYGILAGLFAACLSVFLYGVVMRDYPVRTGAQSLLNLNPSIGMVPQPDHYSTLIAFRMSQRYSFRKYVDELAAFTQWYERTGTGTNGRMTGQGTEGLLNCAENGKRTSDDNRYVCMVNLDIGGNCNLLREFGYEDGQPCVILKLNRIYGWLPDPVDNTSHVQVVCEGMSDIDKDLLGPICYHDDNDIKVQNQCNRPYGEFKSYYFPYLRQVNYQSPLVFVEFLMPAKYTIIMVQCRLIAKNIYVNKARNEGSFRFELLIH